MFISIHRDITQFIILKKVKKNFEINDKKHKIVL